MSSELRNRLHHATTIEPRTVSSSALQTEVARRRRVKLRIGAAGVSAVAAVLGVSLPLALTHSPQGTVRLATSPSPQATPTRAPSPTSSTSMQPTLRVSLSGPPRAGVEATVTGGGFNPRDSVQVVPCLPNSDCGANAPIATVKASSNGDITAHIPLPAVFADYYGNTDLCMQDCTLTAFSVDPFPGSSPAFSAKSAPFDLAPLPPESQQCSPGSGTVRLSYAGPDPAHPASQSAVIRLRNAGTKACWVYGVPGVTADGNDGWRSVVQTSVVDQSGPSWPPEVITLQPGASAQFRLTKPRCPGPSTVMTNLNVGQIGTPYVNYSLSVPLPNGGAQSNVALCTGTPTKDKGPAPDNVMTVTAFTAG